MSLHLGTEVCRFCEIKLSPMESGIVRKSELGGPTLEDLAAKNTVRLALMYCHKCGLVYHA